jgi:hypothetical protein
VRNEFLASVDIDPFIVCDRPELVMNHLIEFVLDWNLERKLERAAGVFAGGNAFVSAV